MFEPQVLAAIDKLMRDQGNLFQNGPLGIQYRDFGAFIVGVMNNLDAAGLCAGFDGEEVQVKSSNDFNEQFKISTSGGYVHRDGAYKSTCRPASFPVGGPPPTIPPPPGCSLPPSTSIACGAGVPAFLSPMKDAIDRVVSEHPELFDLAEVAAGTTDGYKVLNIQQYHADVVANLAKMGFCARFDGEEVALKNTNDFSEQYDILTGANFIRRGDGQYRISCHPAAF